MKKNLGKIIALSLLTASVFSMAQCQVGYCEPDYAPRFDNNSEGDLKGAITRVYETHDTNPRGGDRVAYWVNDGKEHKHKNIDISMSIDYKGETKSIKSTTGLLVVGSGTISSDGGDIKVVNSSKLSNYTTINGIYTNGANAVIDFSKANSVYIVSDKDTYKGDAVSAKDGGTISIATNKEKGFTKIIGDVDFNYRYGKKNGTVNLALNNDDSFWYGDEINSYDKGTFNFILEDGGEWIYSKKSNLSNVTLNKGGIINLVDSDIDDKFNKMDITDGIESGHRYVDVHKLQSDTAQGGIFKLDLQYNADSKKAIYSTTDYFGNAKADVGDKSDYIFVKNGSGTYDVQFELANSNLEDMQNGYKLYFANDESKGVTFVSSTVEALPEKNSASDIYNYKYAVDSADAEGNHQGTDWFITLNENGTNENITSVDGAMKAGYALGTEMDRLNKRLGESRYLSDEKGLWVRYRHARVGMDNSFKTNSNMFQLGYDKQVLEDDGTHYRGLALDYTHGDTSLLGLRGNGEHDRYSLSLYDTWTGDKGHYRDLVLRGGRINSEFDVDNSNSETISSDYHQWFGSISGEWGRKKDTGHDWYFEPQTQLQLARVGGADYVTNHGVRVEQDGATSLIGRLGFRLGREFDKNDAAKRDNYYIKADLLHEFCGDQEYRVTGKDGSLSKTYDGKDTWFDVGVGADITISRNTYFWVDVERTLGGDFDRTWQVNGGFRWEF